jgi:hypothetical protein
MLDTSDRMAGIEVIDVHPDLRVVEGNRLNGNTDPRFSGIDSVRVSRMKLVAAAGCDRMVAMLPKGTDHYEDLDQGRIVSPKAAYDKWPEDLQPAEDVVYIPQKPPRMIDLLADGLVTGRQGNGLMLNAADCSPTVIYDPDQRVLALVHNGRDGAALDIGPKVVSHLQKTYGTKPADLVVHFGAAIAPESYLLTYLGEPLRQDAWRPYLREVDGAFETDIVGFAAQSLLEKGVPGANISRSPIDTFTHPDFFSFTEHQGDRANVPDGRNGFIATILRPTGVRAV